MNVENSTYSNTSTLNILNTYASVRTVGKYSITGLIGILDKYESPSQNNKITIDNFYYAPYTANTWYLSGLICNASNSSARPEVTHIYIEQDTYQNGSANDYIAPHVNTIITYQKKPDASGHNTFVGDKPLVDVLNENRGDHAEWIEKVLPDSKEHIPTLFLPPSDAP